METELHCGMSYFFQKSDDGPKVPKKKSVSVNFSHPLFSLLFTYDDLVMHALFWLSMVQFRGIWLDALYVNLR
jgi:hypothetical protein